MSSQLPDITPIPIKERLSLLFVERCRVDVRDNAFVMIDKKGVRTHVPIGGIACLMLEPGVRLSHRAAHLAAKTGTLLVWVGECGVRLYSAGQPGGARSDKLLYQAKLALSEKGRLNVVREMYRRRFEDAPPANRSVPAMPPISFLPPRLLKLASPAWRRMTSPLMVCSVTASSTCSSKTAPLANWMVTDLAAFLMPTSATLRKVTP